jgi:hypothetical protein
MDSQPMPKKIKDTVIGFRILGVFAVLLALFIPLFIYYVSVQDKARISMDDARSMILFAGIGVGSGVLQVITASGISKRSEWSRTVGIIICVLMLLGFPLGTLLGILFLSKLLSAEARVWFSGSPTRVEGPSSS